MVERASPKDAGVRLRLMGERLQGVIGGHLEAAQLPLPGLEVGAVEAWGVDVVAGEAGDDVWPAVELDVEALQRSSGGQPGVPRPLLLSSVGHASRRRRGLRHT